MQAIARSMINPLAWNAAKAAALLFSAALAIVFSMQGWVIALLNTDGTLAKIVVSPIIILAGLAFATMAVLAMTVMAERIWGVPVEEAKPKQKIDEQALDNVSTRLDSSLSTVIELVGSTLAASGRYNDALTKAESDLKTLPDPKLVQKAIRNLLTENAAIKNEVQALKGRLEVAQTETQELRAELENALSQGLIDALTGLKNRRWFDKNVAKEVKSAHQQAVPLCLAILDIDHFKRINDNYGHRTGDTVLTWCGNLLQQSLKGRDTAVRYGGEEFAIILPRTNLFGATTLLENIRTEFHRTKWQHKSSGREIGVVTASFGIAQLREEETLEALIERADANLYTAKAEGRNKIVATE